MLVLGRILGGTIWIPPVLVLSYIQCCPSYQSVVRVMYFNSFFVAGLFSVPLEYLF